MVQWVAIAAVLQLLVGCFNIPILTRDSESGGGATLVNVVPTSDDAGKLVASVASDSALPQVLSVASESPIKGAEVTISPNSLALPTDVIMEASEPLDDSSILQDVGLSSSVSVTESGAGVLVRPATETISAQPLGVKIPLPPSLATAETDSLGLDTTQTLAILYKVATAEGLVSGILDISLITVANGFAGFEAPNFGAFQAVILSTQVTPVQVATEDPLRNAQRVSVATSQGFTTEESVVQTEAVAAIVWGTTQISYGAATRTVTVTGQTESAAELSISNCKVQLRRNVVVPEPSFDTPTGEALTGSVVVAEASAVTLFGRLSCVDSVGRRVDAPWSDALALPAVTAMTLTLAEALGVSTTYDFAVNGGAGPYTVAALVNEGGQALGTISFMDSGFQLVTGTVVGNYQVQVTDAFGSVVTQWVSLVVPVAVTDNCSADGQVGCVTTSAFPAVDVSALAARVLVGQTVANVAGTQAGGLTTCSSDGQQNCIASSPYFAASTCVEGGSSCYLPAYSVGVQSLRALNYDAVNSSRSLFSTALTIFDLSGQLATCGAGNASGCIATTSYPTMDLSVSVGTSLTASNFESALADSGNTYQFWDATGSRHTMTGDADLVVGNLKSGVTIHGVAGDYPSSTYPLPSATATADLTHATLNAQLKSATSFEYWTSDGSYQISAGDDDIVASNIISSATIYGTIGSVPPPTCANLTTSGTCTAVSACTWNGSACLLDAVNVRVAMAVEGVTGTLKVNCRTFGNSSRLNNDSIVNTAGTAGGTMDWWDTIDHFNNNTDSLPSEAPSGWTSDNDCGRELWTDLTSGGCDDATDDCVMYDQVTGLSWTESAPVTATGPASTNETWAVAATRCNSLTYASFSDWRLPTVFELQAAVAHGIREVGYMNSGTVRPSGDTLNNNDAFITQSADMFWAATSHSQTTTSAYAVNLASGATSTYDKAGTSRDVICVR